MNTTTMASMWTRSSATSAPARVAPRYYVRTVGPRHHVVDDATGYTVAAYWTVAEANADRLTRGTTAH